MISETLELINPNYEKLQQPTANANVDSLFTFQAVNFWLVEDSHRTFDKLA